MKKDNTLLLACWLIWLVGLATILNGCDVKIPDNQPIKVTMEGHDYWRTYGGGIIHSFSCGICRTNRMLPPPPPGFNIPLERQ